MLELDDEWIWDFWTAEDAGRYHAFFLVAPKSLGDPDLRHAHARIGHAMSEDLRSWTRLPNAVGPGPPGAWDDMATWTGSVLRHDGRWHLFYTGGNAGEGGRVQRIGLAVSDDLEAWHKPLDGPLLTSDPRWYEQLATTAWPDEAWRDPWVFPDPSGSGFRMLVTARANTGDADARGVIGQARSADLLRWEVLPPLTEPGDFGHMEVPQIVTIGRHSYLLFSVYDWAHSAARLRRAPAVSGTHYLMADDPLGPYRAVTDDFLSVPAGPLYAGRLVQGPGGRWVFLAFVQFDADGAFVGTLSDPVEVVQAEDGSLSLAAQPDMGAAERGAPAPAAPAHGPAPAHRPSWGRPPDVSPAG